MGRVTDRTELLIGAWRQRFLDGECELDEFEAGVDHAMRGVWPTVASWEVLAVRGRLFECWVVPFVEGDFDRRFLSSYR